MGNIAAKMVMLIHWQEMALLVHHSLKLYSWYEEIRAEQIGQKNLRNIENLLISLLFKNLTKNSIVMKKILSAKNISMGSVYIAIKWRDYII